MADICSHRARAHALVGLLMGVCSCLPEAPTFVDTPAGASGASGASSGASGSSNQPGGAAGNAGNGGTAGATAGTSGSGAAGVAGTGGNSAGTGGSAATGGSAGVGGLGGSAGVTGGTGGNGGNGGNGGSGGMQCTSGADCPGVDTVCRTRTCTNGACGVDFALQGTEDPVQDPGDCQKRVCDGNGAFVNETDDNDLPLDDGNQCTDEICTSGVASHPNMPLGTGCTQQGGTQCNNAGVCVVPIPCASGILGDGPTGPSCTGLPATCGVNANESCCRSLLVPGNATNSACSGQAFYRDYDAASGNYDTMQHPATVSTFALDRYEVTVGRFKKFLAAFDTWRLSNPTMGAGKHPNIPGDPGWDTSWPLASTAAVLSDSNHIAQISSYTTWNSSSSANDNRAINFVNFYEAYAFCIWDGGYLPSEAEWMYAASGGSEQRAYPWSTPASSTGITSSHASYYNGTNCTGDGLNNGCSFTDIIKVGTKVVGDARWGHADLGGNVYEWTMDRWDGAATYSDPCDNCANFVGVGRVQRGGCITSGASLVRAAYRNYSPASDIYHGVGIRCARTP